MENRGEVILYQPDNEIKLEVRLEDETVWLNRQQLSELFNRDVKTIGKHINNALKEELIGWTSNCRKFCDSSKGRRTDCNTTCGILQSGHDSISRLQGKIQPRHRVPSLGEQCPKGISAERLFRQSPTDGT